VRGDPAAPARCLGAHYYFELGRCDTPGFVVVLVCPGAVVLWPCDVVVVFVCPGAVVLRPCVVVIFVRPGAVALRPGDALTVVVFVSPEAVALWPRWIAALAFAAGVAVAAGRRSDAEGCRG
jgi:hypothetical protein